MDRIAQVRVPKPSPWISVKKPRTVMSIVFLPLYNIPDLAKATCRYASGSESQGYKAYRSQLRTGAHSLSR